MLLFISSFKETFQQDKASNYILFHIHIPMILHAKT